MNVMFVHKRYLCDVLFKLNVITIIYKKNNKINKVSSFIIWLSLLIYSIHENSEHLYLINIDIYDLKFMQTRGDKKYFITFIDYCTKYCCVYLLRSKYKALEVFKHFKRRG